MDLLTKKLHENDRMAFDEVYSCFHQKAYQFMLRYMRNSSDAQELTQMLFVRLWTKRHQLSLRKPLEAQVFVIARNLAIDELRKKARQHTLQSDYQAVVPSTSNCTEEAILLQDMTQHLQGVIDLMPPKRKEIFHLSRRDGLSYREIANRQSISVKTVENQMSKALHFLRVKMTSFLSFLL